MNVVSNVTLTLHVILSTRMHVTEFHNRCCNTHQNALLVQYVYGVWVSTPLKTNSPL
jgi:hypothetical protein